MPFNQFAGVRVTGSWEDHAGYSAGGTDYPLAYGTAIMAPARGKLYTSGRPPGVNESNEWACGWVGTAGRRSILMFETPIPRPISAPRRNSPPEGTGSMVAIVIQHQSAFGIHSGSNLIYGENQGPIGWSGASASGQDIGGDTHLHWHGLNAAGQRVRAESFLSPRGSTAGDGSSPLPIILPKEDNMILLTAVGKIPTVISGGYSRQLPVDGFGNADPTWMDCAKAIVDKTIEVNAAQFDIINALCIQGKAAFPAS